LNATLKIDFTQAGYVQKIYACLRPGDSQTLNSLQQRYPDYALLALGVYIDIFGFEQLEDKNKASPALIELIENCYLTYKLEPLCVDFIYSAVNKLLRLYKADQTGLDFLLRQRLKKHFAMYSVASSELLAAKMIILVYAFSCFIRSATYISSKSLELLESIYLNTENNSLHASLRHFFIEDVLSLSLEKNLVVTHYLQPIIFKDLQMKSPSEFCSLDPRDCQSEIHFFREQYSIIGATKHKIVDANNFLSYQLIAKAWEQIAQTTQTSDLKPKIQPAHGSI